MEMVNIPVLFSNMYLLPGSIQDQMFACDVCFFRDFCADMMTLIFIGNSILVEGVTAYKEIIVSSDDAVEDTIAGDSEEDALAPSNETEIEHIQPIDSKSVGSQSLANSTAVGVQPINNTQATTTIEIGTTQALSVETINVDNPRHGGNTSEARTPTTMDAPTEAVNPEDSESDIEIEEIVMLGSCDCTRREENTPFCMHEETGLISHRSKCTRQTNPSDCKNVTGATHIPAVACTWIPIPINNDEDKNIGGSMSDASFQVICIGSGGSPYENDVSAYLLTSYTGTDMSQEHYLLMDGGSFFSGIQHSIDAGVLPPNASQAVGAVAIGHTHLDHILGYAMGTPEMKSHTLIGLPNTVEVLQHHIFNGGICNLSSKIPISCKTICIETKVLSTFLKCPPS
jgi:hypothetical protein